MQLSKYTEVAVLAAKAAGKIHKQYFNKRFSVKTKNSSFDLVTTADLVSEKKIISVIRKHFPEHNFLAEEKRYKKTNSKYTWIIDPLDGTNNFVFGMPIFSVSIACARGNQLITGVVYDAMRDELFLAEAGRGAFMNGKRIRVNSISKLNKSLLITGFYYDRGKKMVEGLEKIKQFFYRSIVGIRRLGSAALDLCYVACGRAAGFWEFELNPWDFAAGKLIIKEAGGAFSDKHDKSVPLKKSFIVASNGKIHQKMLSVLNM